MLWFVWELAIQVCCNLCCDLGINVAGTKINICFNWLLKFKKVIIVCASLSPTYFMSISKLKLFVQVYHPRTICQFLLFYVFCSGDSETIRKLKLSLSSKEAFCKHYLVGNHLTVLNCLILKSVTLIIIIIIASHEDEMNDKYNDKLCTSNEVISEMSEEI